MSIDLFNEYTFCWFLIAFLWVTTIALTMSKQVSGSSDDSEQALDPPTLLYHESARHIVFRDQIRRVQRRASVEEASYSSSASPSRYNSPPKSRPGGISSSRSSSRASSPVTTRRPGGVSRPNSRASSRTPPRVRPGGVGAGLKSEKPRGREVVPPHPPTPPRPPTPPSTQPPTVQFEPLAPLELSQYSTFEPLVVEDLEQHEELTPLESHVVELLETEQAVVKTLRNSDWTQFFLKFPHAEYSHPPFKTSTSLLPSRGLKMRCFGSTKEFTVGCVFALPTAGDREWDAYKSSGELQAHMEATNTWAWPSGYAAKTEFNVDPYGNLINGRKEALVTLEELRQLNDTYLNKQDYMIGGRIIEGGLTHVPYNEIMPAVGGTPPTVATIDGVPRIKRSFEDGLGYPVALFVRTATYGNLVAMLRTRARAIAVLEINRDIPLLCITPEQGARVLTKQMQGHLFANLARNLNPFQNPILYKTGVDDYATHGDQMQQKLEELFDLNDGEWRSKLTAEECARIAGGFGATDDSVAQLLMDALHEDQLYREHLTSFSYKDGRLHEGHELQDVVNEGLVAAVRSGDYHTSRQLLILYTLVASRGERDAASRRGRNNSVDSLSSASSSSSRSSVGLTLEKRSNHVQDTTGSSGYASDSSCSSSRRKPTTMMLDTKRDIKAEPESPVIAELPALKSTAAEAEPKIPIKADIPKTSSSDDQDQLVPQECKTLTRQESEEHWMEAVKRVPRIPNVVPPPLDTNRLRSATNSDGLLAVLGAAQVLKSMQDGSARTKTKECIEALQEWVATGEEQGVAFRLAAWRDQRAAQADLKIAMQHQSDWTAFVGKHALVNRKHFCTRLKRAMETLDFTQTSFLKLLHDMLSEMNSPCLRLELLQYILGLDNRYSVAHVARSVELAATCMNITRHDLHYYDPDDDGGVQCTVEQELAALDPDKIYA